ncbi:UNVERIFIED_ORG: hypothetical protein GGE64_005142 [Rhizobium etli]
MRAIDSAKALLHVSISPLYLSVVNRGYLPQYEAPQIKQWLSMTKLEGLPNPRGCYAKSRCF